jgi:hypothetical protein
LEVLYFTWKLFIFNGRLFLVVTIMNFLVYLFKNFKIQLFCYGYNFFVMDTTILFWIHLFGHTTKLPFHVKTPTPP